MFRERIYHYLLKDLLIFERNFSNHRTVFVELFLYIIERIIIILLKTRITYEKYYSDDK
jgi:hypothetical protein